MKKITLGLIALSSFSVFAQSTSYEKAMNLKDANISCQQYKTEIEKLLSESPLNVQTIRTSRGLLDRCIDDVSGMIETALSNTEDLVIELYSKGMICAIEKDKFDDVISIGISNSSELDSIIDAKENLDQCQTTALEILNS
jgi:hypothetical protein